MKRRYAVIIGIAFGLVGSLVGLAAVARPATQQARQPATRPAGPTTVPQLPKDTGTGELLLAVVGGVYTTEAEAEAVNAAMVFGDMAGYYVVPVDQFDGFKEQADLAGSFALVSVFRTDEGAREFAELATAFGYPAKIFSQRVKSLGGEYAGLGQEADPDGTGPLLGPTSESLGLAEPEA